MESASTPRISRSVSFNTVNIERPLHPTNSNLSNQEVISDDDDDINIIEGNNEAQSEVNKLSYATYSASEDDGALAMAAREVALKTRRALDIRDTSALTPPNSIDTMNLYKQNNELMTMLEDLRNRIDQLEQIKTPSTTTSPTLLSVPIDKRSGVIKMDKRSGVITATQKINTQTPKNEPPPVIRVTALEALSQIGSSTNNSKTSLSNKTSPARSPTRSPRIGPIRSNSNQYDHKMSTDFGFGNNIEKPPRILSNGSPSLFTTPQFLTPNGSPTIRKSSADLIVQKGGHLKIPNDFPPLPAQALQTFPPSHNNRYMTLLIGLHSIIVFHILSLSLVFNIYNPCN